MNRKSQKRRGELFWPKIVLKKWLNISTKDSDFSADEEADTESEVDDEEMGGCDHELRDVERRLDRLASNVSTSENAYFKPRRRKSETLRAQYINTKELRICVVTWNVGGRLPPDDLGIEEWLDMEEPADIYVLGLQEIVPLNAGNVLGAEDNRPVPRWESIIRETLNRLQPVKTKVKCHSDPPSPSRFKPFNDAPAIEEELLSETDSGSEEEVHPLDDQSFNFDIGSNTGIARGDESECTQASIFAANADLGLSKEPESYLNSYWKRLDRLHHFNVTDYKENPEISVSRQKIKLARTLSNSERVRLTWPEQPLDLPGHRSLLSSNSFKSVKSFQACTSFKSMVGETKVSPEAELIPELNRLNSIIYRRKRSPYVRVISKQMVGIFLTIWVRRSLRKHIQNLKVSTVGVGVLGYIGNKGSISVSMSIYQTMFCFICTHLTAGEKEGDELRRNADVQEIHRRTWFSAVPGIALPKTILDHERVIWLGDLNYRINLSYDKTMELISRKDWYRLAEMDQLKRELKKGRAFDGWTEGVLTFPPTYKYEFNSGKYIGADPKAGRRTPAWCDRILSFGKGTRLLDYKRSELSLSDHRPVTAIFMAEVEVFSPRKLQRALTFTDAEVEDCGTVSETDDDSVINHVRLGEVSSSKRQIM